MGRKNYLKQKEKGESHINFRPTGKKKHESICISRRNYLQQKEKDTNINYRPTGEKKLIRMNKQEKVS